MPLFEIKGRSVNGGLFTKRVRVADYFEAREKTNPATMIVHSIALVDEHPDATRARAIAAFANR